MGRGQRGNPCRSSKRPQALLNTRVSRQPQWQGGRGGRGTALRRQRHRSTRLRLPRVRAIGRCVWLRHRERRVARPDGKWREGGEHRANGVVLLNGMKTQECRALRRLCAQCVRWTHGTWELFIVVNGPVGLRRARSGTTGCLGPQSGSHTNASSAKGSRVPTTEGQVHVPQGGVERWLLRSLT